jgi:predicted transcriptional regulator
MMKLKKQLSKRKAELAEKNLKPLSKEQYQSEIDEAMEDSENGKMIKATDLKEKIQKWD